MTKEKPTSRKSINCAFPTGTTSEGRAPLDFQDLAARALAYIAGKPERLAGFLALTGLSPTSVRSAAAEAGFARGILSYLASDEGVLVGFAASEGCDPAVMAGDIQAAVGTDHDEWS